MRRAILVFSAAIFASNLHRMISQTDNNARLSVIDRVFSIMDSHNRPQDFTLLMHLRDTPTLDALRAGATRARDLYPTAGANIHKQHWVRCFEPNGGISACSVSSTEEMVKAISEFVDNPFDLRRSMPVQQLVVIDTISGEVKLATRFHHAAADGFSALLWLNHQLRVARERESPV